MGPTPVPPAEEKLHIIMIFIVLLYMRAFPAVLWGRLFAFWKMRIISS